jgi:hypothetical protein
VPQPACTEAREALTAHPAGTPQQCSLPPKPAACRAGRSDGAAIRPFIHERQTDGDTAYIYSISVTGVGSVLILSLFNNAVSTAYVT